MVHFSQSNKLMWLLTKKQVSKQLQRHCMLLHCRVWQLLIKRSLHAFLFAQHLHLPYIHCLLLSKHPTSILPHYLLDSHSEWSNLPPHYLTHFNSSLQVEPDFYKTLYFFSHGLLGFLWWVVQSSSMFASFHTAHLNSLPHIGILAVSYLINLHVI